MALTRSRVRSILNQWRGKRVLVLGDLMLDRYLWGAVDRISPEAPVPVLEVQEETLCIGGAANVAHTVVALGGAVALIGVIGEDDNGRALGAELRARNLPADGLVPLTARPTTTKTRVVARNQHLVRFDHESRAELTHGEVEQVWKRVLEALPSTDAIVVSDYGKGVITKNLLDRLLPEAKGRGIPVCVDPKDTHFMSYEGVAVVTPNQHEAAEVLGYKLRDDALVSKAGTELLGRLGADAVLITRGSEGMSLFQTDKRSDLKAVARSVYDVTGAGDTVVATYALAIAGGAEPIEAAELANRAAGDVVQQVGTAVPRIVALEALGHSRVYTAEGLLEQRERWANQGKRVVFTNGCFDILHQGHMDLLTKAKALGDILVVGINTDRSVRELKGPERPLIPEGDRSRLLAGIRSVDAVVLFDEATPLQLIEALTPEILVKGGDYDRASVVGGDAVEAAGGEVVLIPLTPDRSTTRIVTQMRELAKADKASQTGHEH